MTLPTTPVVTAPANDAAGRPPSPWYVRPAVVLPLVSALIIVTALLAPLPSTGRNGNSVLTTNSTEPLGASLVYDLARRLGWQVERSNRQALDSATDLIHAVLDPVVPLRATETHALLEQVRKGAALLVVLNQEKSELAESLHVKAGRLGGYVLDPRDPRLAACPPRSRMDRLIALWPDDNAQLLTLEWTATRDAAANTPVDTLLTVQALQLRRPNMSRLPAVMGTTLGAGRVVIASDPDFLRNDALRVCKYGLDVVAVRALEYLRDGGPRPRRRLVFDEYHQRANHQPGTVATVTAFLSGTQSGHVLFQLLGAGLLLLVARAPRAIPPRDRQRIERRSPLEHVDALGRAYAQVDGTRTAAALLVRGLRRRVEHGTGHYARALDQHTDERFLERLDESHPKLRSDIALLRRGLHSQLSVKDFALLGSAVQRIEQSLVRL